MTDAAGTVTLTAADGSTTTCPAVDFSSVGVCAVDEHTLTYTLNYDFPGFLSLLNYAPFEPAYGLLPLNMARAQRKPFKIVLLAKGAAAHRLCSGSF